MTETVSETETVTESGVTVSDSESDWGSEHGEC